MRHRACLSSLPADVDPGPFLTDRMQMMEPSQTIVRESGPSGKIGDSTGQIMAPSSVLRQLLETTEEGFWYIDADGATIAVNPAMCRILGRVEAEIIGRSIFDFVDAVNAEIFHAEMRKRKLGIYGPYEIALQRPDGANVPCINNATPVLNEQGERIASIGLWTDISDRKRTETLLLCAKEEAERASLAKSDFLSSVSHELRSPLHAVLGYAELLSQDQNHPLDPVQRDRVQRLMTAGEHLSQLIEGVLDLSKIEAGQINVSPEKVDPCVVVDNVNNIALALAERNAISFINKAQGKVLPPISADATRLQQILLNLLSNAVKYNKTGGSVTLDCTIENNSALRFSVSDTGVGIASEDHANLFEPFNRLGRENGNVEGTGVGLSVTRKLVELMGGSISMQSEFGRGSTFNVDLPLFENACALPEEAEDRPQCEFSQDGYILPRGLTILYVEDHPDLAELMSNIIAARTDWNLTTVESAEEALPLAETLLPDAILMDINLSGMDGISAMRHLKDNPATCRIPVIAVTGAATRCAVDYGLSSGFDGYVTKPFKATHLLAEISLLVTSAVTAA